MPIADKSDAGGALRSTLGDALKLIARENPKRPQEFEAKTPEMIHRERDVKQLKEVFYWINVSMLDGVLNGRLGIIGLDFCDYLEAIINAAGFHFYDATLQGLLIDFYKAWEQCDQHADAMETNTQSTELRFVLPMDAFVSREQERQYKETKSFAVPLRQTLDALLNYVRANYLEIDVSASGAEAVRKCNSPAR